MSWIDALQQHALNVFDEDGTLLGAFFADLLVNQNLKASRALANEHVAQLLGYMRAVRVEHGLLINFGSPGIEVRKFVLSEPV